MIRPKGNEYTVRLSVDVLIEVTGTSADDAGDKAIKKVEEDLSMICGMAEAEVMSVERSDEVLDVTEDE